MYYGHRASSDYVRKNVQLSNEQHRGMNRGGVNNAPRRQAQMRQAGGTMNVPHTTSRNKSFNQNPGTRSTPAPRQFSAPASRPAPNHFGGGRMGGGFGGGGHMGGGGRGGRR